MQAGLGISSDNIVITSITEGSVIINYNLIIDENSTLNAEDLKTLSEIMISAGAIDLGGPLLNFEQGETTDENGDSFVTVEEPDQDDSDDSASDTTDFEEVEDVRITNDASGSSTLVVTDPKVVVESGNSSIMVAAVVMTSLLLVAILMVFFLVYYRQKKNHEDMIKKVHQNVELLDDDVDQFNANDLLKQRAMRDKLEIDDNLSQKNRPDDINSNFMGSIHSQNFSMQPDANGNFDQKQMIQMFSMFQELQKSNADGKAVVNPLLANGFQTNQRNMDIFTQDGQNSHRDANGRPVSGMNTVLDGGVSYHNGVNSDRGSPGQKREMNIHKSIDQATDSGFQFNKTKLNMNIKNAGNTVNPNQLANYSNTPGLISNSLDMTNGMRDSNVTQSNLLGTDNLQTG